MSNTVKKDLDPPAPTSANMTWYQVTLSSIGDAVLTTDPEGRVAYMNPAAEALTGWLPAQALGQPLESVFRIVNEETREAVEQPVRKVIETGQVRGMANHTLLIAKDGAERPIDDSAAPVRDEAGNLIGVVLIFRDISEQRQRERVVQNALAYAESIIATVRDPLIVLDAELRVRSASRSFYEKFHVEPEATEGRFFYDLGSGQWNIPSLKKLLEELLPEDGFLDNYLVDHDFEHIGPRSMLLNARCFPSDKPFELILIAIEDITDQQQARRQIEETERRKDEFVTTLAHELRNPLSAISSAAKILQLSPSSEDRAWSAEVIGHQVRTLSRLVEDMLDVSRLSRGQINLRTEPVDLGPVIARAVDSVAALVRERDQTLSVDVSGEPMVLQADPTRLEQVFSNLLTNAAKYTPQGGSIALTAEPVDRGFRVRVRDTGEGISAEMLPRLFEMFTQAESSRQSSRGGLGIGLTLVKKIVEMHGGSVEARSEGLGLGSEFCVSLPSDAGRSA